MSVETDILRPWRRTSRSATRIAVVAVSSTVAAMGVGATLPLWIGDAPIRVGMTGAYSGARSSWLWEFSALDAWWVVGVVLLVPVLCTVVGAFRSLRRLVHASQNMPRAVDLSTIGPALSDGRRTALIRSREAERAERQRQFTEQNRHRPSLWTWLGGPFTGVLGGWVLVGIALDITGATDTVLGAWIATRSWLLVILVPVAVAAVYAVSGRFRAALAKRRRRVGT